MGSDVTSDKLHDFMRAFAAAAKGPGSVFLTGGASAVLLGFRESTPDLTLRLDPEPAGASETMADLQKRLGLTIKRLSPSDFMPTPPGWHKRSRYIASYGGVSFYHVDFALQALAALERGSPQDLNDVRPLFKEGFLTPPGLLEAFATIEPELPRYPAVDATRLAKKVRLFLSNLASAQSA